MDDSKDAELSFFRASINERFKHIKDTRDQTLVYIKTQNALFEKINLHLHYSERMQELVSGGEWMQGLLYPLVCSHYEVEQSFYLCLEGFYKQGIAGLRNALELSILFFYFAELISIDKIVPGNLSNSISILENNVENLRPLMKDSKEKQVFQRISNFLSESKKSNNSLAPTYVLLKVVKNLESIFVSWIRSNRDTILPGKLLKILEQNASFQDFNEKFGIVEEIKEIYRDLSNYVHSRGQNYLIDNINQHINSFIEDSFKKFMDHFFSVIKIIIKLQLIRNPDLRNPPPQDVIDLEDQHPDLVIFGYFNEYSIEQLRSILSQSEFEYFYPDFHKP